MKLKTSRKSFLLFSSSLCCCALLTATSSAQVRDNDPATKPPPPPAKGGVYAPEDKAENTPRAESPRTDRPSTVHRNDRAITEHTRFEVLDTDGDDRISRAEFTLAPNVPLQSSGLPGEAGRSMSEAQRSQGNIASGTTDSNLTSARGTNPSELFDQIDTDNDGFLSRAELAMHHSNNRLPK